MGEGIVTGIEPRTFAERLTAIRERIATAAARAGRSPEEVTLVAVSKTFPVEAIREAAAAGLRIFGESRAQEALPKLDALADLPLCWHLIGHLQRNKVHAVAGRFELIHTADSVRLIEALEARAGQLCVTQPILLQINVSGEAAKHGAAPEELEQLLDAADACAHIAVRGLMTIPPYDENPEKSRPHFARLRELADHLGNRYPSRPRHLSMGMSGDLEVAVEEGASLVRVGSALFGARS
jgi:pyridoxal phosphate enzyme (YggS family)